MKRLYVLLVTFLTASSVFAQFRPPPFIGGIPGHAQFRAIETQRHQARTLLYREALDELRKNPKAADLPDCPAGQTPRGGQCLARTDASLASLPAPIAKPSADERAPTTQASPVRRRFALLIGNNSYASPIPPLETPIADVSTIASVLQTRFGFETRIVKDAGKTQLIEAFNDIAAQAAPDDSVLLFYAGHGYLLEDVKMGYWIPVDASVKTAKGWISNSDISKLLSSIRARQLILVSDSCYSGTLTEEQKLSDSQTLKADEILKQRSVLVLSSGADEPVSDEGKEGHSIFAWNLLKTLKSTASVTPGAKIWTLVRTDVSKEYEQEPQYGAVVSAGHVAGGDFLFQTAK